MENKFQLKYLHISCGSDVEPIASVVLSINGFDKKGCSHGNCPFDALFKALEEVSQSDAQFIRFKPLQKRRGAKAKVIVTLKSGFFSTKGDGCSFDTTTACAEAYVKALNKIEAKKDLCTFFKNAPKTIKSRLFRSGQPAGGSMTAR